MFFWRKHPIRDVDLSAYVDGQLEPPARDRLEAHIETCTPCREALAELRALRSALQELPPAMAPRSFALREADVRVEAKPSLTPARPPALLGGLASVALVAFVALVGVDVLGQPSVQRDVDTNSPMSAEALQDGTEIKISSNNRAGDDKDDGSFLTGGLATVEPNVSDGFSDVPPNDAAGPETNQRGEIDNPDEATVNSFATPECQPGRECTQLRFSDSANGEAEPESECPPGSACVRVSASTNGEAEPAPEGMPEPAPEAASDLAAEPADDNRLPLRAGEVAAAVVALVAGGSFALIWRRRRV